MKFNKSINSIEGLSDLDINVFEVALTHLIEEVERYSK